MYGVHPDLCYAPRNREDQIENRQDFEDRLLSMFKIDFLHLTRPKRVNFPQVVVKFLI